MTGNIIPFPNENPDMETVIITDKDSISGTRIFTNKNVVMNITGLASISENSLLKE